MEVHGHEAILTMFSGKDIEGGAAVATTKTTAGEGQGYWEDTLPLRGEE